MVPLKERVSHYKGLAKTPEGLTDYSQDFFGKPTFLTVSGQLNAEMYATAMSDVYTFGEACPSCINLSTTYSSCCLQLTLPAVYNLLFLLSTVYYLFFLLSKLTLPGVYSVAGVYSFSGVYSVAGVYSFSGVCSLSGVYSLSGVLFTSGVYSLSGCLHYSLVRFTVTVGRVARMHNNSLGSCCVNLSVYAVCLSCLS